ncbi:beta subunit of citrate lyase [Neoconidiobolus thromboides FSU 785]|nr:beta subunit of citrate lyase [Neoconidiobolus thromboides FSU 785]
MRNISNLVSRQLQLVTRRNIVTSVNQRIRRALFYVPGSDPRKLTSSMKLTADCLTYDLEDSVPFQSKDLARNQVLATLNESTNTISERAVRINHVGSGFEHDDLDIILKSENLQAIVIPKVQSSHDISFVSHMIDLKKNPKNKNEIAIIASIESALAIMNLQEIAKSDKKLGGLIFAAEDFCADLGLKRTSDRKEMLYARSAMVTTAKAYQLQAIDLVCLEFKDSEILKQECEEGYQMGFTGKQAIHPNQVSLIQSKFIPDDKEIEKATKILEGYEKHSLKGFGAFELDGQVIDLPVVKWAERVLARVPK